MSWVALVVSIAACGETAQSGGGRDPLPFASGSRLRAQLVDAGEGAVVFFGWYDQELEQSCTFLPTVDGRVRCLPMDDSSRAFITPFDVLYTDGACSDPVRVFPLDASLPRYFVGEPESVEPCGPTAETFRVYEIGDEVHPTDTLRYRFDGECRLSQDPSTVRSFALGAELDPDRLVAAERILEDTDDDRLAAITEVAEDGAHRITGIQDRDRDDECAPGFGWGEKAGACIPTQIAWGIGEFGDDACTEPTAYTSPYVPGGADASCAMPGVIVDFTGSATGCHGIEPEFYEPGPRVDFSYWAGGGGCALQSDASHANFTYGAPIDPSSFAQIGAADVGRGRVTASYATAGGTLLYGNTGFFDKDFGSTCNELAICDGTTRCVPLAGSYQRTYVDPECTTLVVQATQNECRDDTSLPVQLVPDEGQGECVTNSEIFEIGPAVATPEALFVREDGTCVSASYPVDATVTYHAIGAAIDLGGFVRLERRTE